MSTSRITAPFDISGAFRLFLPMAVAAWLTTLAPPVINAAIVRVASDPEAAIAAYGVDKNLIFLLAPYIVMIPNGLLVLVIGPESFRRYRVFVAALGLFSTAMLASLLTAPIGGLVFGDLLGLPETVAVRARQAMVPFLAFPALGVARALAQGVIVRAHRTGIMAVSGGISFLVHPLGVILGPRFSFLPGAVFGAGLLVTSAALDALLLSLAALRYRGRIGDGSSTPSYREILLFFLPLVVTTAIMGASRTIIDAGLARTPRPELELAAFTVAASLVFAFEAPVVVLRNLTLAYEPTPRNTRGLAVFCLAVGGVMAGIVVLGAFSGGATVVMERFVGVGAPVRARALPAIPILAAALFVLSRRQFNYARLMRERRTNIIGISAVARLVFLAAALLVGLRLAPSGWTAAVVYVLGFLLETVITEFAAGRKPALSSS